MHVGVHGLQHNNNVDISHMTPPDQDLSRTAADLLADLDRLALEGTSVGNPKANTIAVITAVRKFASLLAVLSREAFKQQDAVIRLTKSLRWLTTVLLVVAIVQIIVSIFR